MSTQLTPFNLKLLQLTPANIGRMQAITAQDTFDGATKNFHPTGLFSSEIFGRVGDKMRMRNFAYIDIKVPVLHPLVLRILGKLKRIYPEILFGKAYAVWDPKVKDFIKSTPVEGQTGFTFFMDHFEEIMFDDRLSDSRELNIKFLNKVRKMATNDRIIVSPAGYRDYVIKADGREEEDEVNPLYRRLISLANAVTREGFKASPQAYDKTRSALQRTFTEIYEYHESIVRGKNKLTEGKFLTRAIQFGTRNTITAQTSLVQKLDEPQALSFHSTVVGLFQYLKAFQPVCTHQIRSGFLQEVFISPSAPANLINPKTLRREQVQVPTEMFDLWMSSEGINRLFNYYGEEQFRHDEIKIGDHYLGLIYNDGKSYRIFGDIDELPEGYDPKFVKPVTYTELFYDAVYPHTHKYIANVTRYPITGFGSTYPSEPYLKVTMPTQSLAPLGDDWQPSQTKPHAYLFPVRGAAFVNSIQPAPNKLGNLGADFDGDKCSFIGIFLEESVQECKKVLTSRNFHVRTDGSIAHSLATDTVKYLLKGMLRNVGTVARESYREEPTSEFTHNGKKYNLNKVLAYIDSNSIQPKEFKVSDLSWVLQYDTPDQARVDKADLTKPIVVVEHYSETTGSSLVAVDGLHRVAKAVQEGVKVLKGYELTQQQLIASQKVSATESEAALYMDVGHQLPAHLLDATQTKTQGAMLASTTTSLLKPAMSGVHLTSTMNGTYVSTDQIRENVPVNKLSWPRSYSFGIEQEAIDNLTLHGTELLEVEYHQATDTYYVLGSYTLLAKLLQNKVSQFNVRVVSVSH